MRSSVRVLNGNNKIYPASEHHPILMPNPRSNKIQLLSCDFDGCPYKTFYLGSLHAHKITTHAGKLPVVRGICKNKISAKGFQSHCRTHTGQRPFLCVFPGCGSAFSHSSNLTVHKKTHTLEGQIRRKKQENQVNKLLKEWGYTVDCETTINALSGKCLTDTQRHFSRLDFRIVNCVNAICILEVDEDQHYWYNLSCEMSRMADVRASLVLAGYTLPIYWIRYSPNGKYRVGSEQIKIHRPRRENVLKKHLANVCSTDFTPDNQENIHYMFYDLVSEEEGPEITRDPDFPDAMKNVVSW